MGFALPSVVHSCFWLRPLTLLDAFMQSQNQGHSPSTQQAASRSAVALQLLRQSPHYPLRVLGNVLTEKRIGQSAEVDRASVFELAQSVTSVDQTLCGKLESLIYTLLHQL